MEIEKMKSNLRMSHLYFSECSVIRGRDVKEGKYQADLKRDIRKTEEHEYDIELCLSIKKDDLTVSVKAYAHFLYEADEYSKEEDIIKDNTVAIMFPFIRSQVTLLTTQPGMMPIVLPPINTQKFI